MAIRITRCTVLGAGASVLPMGLTRSSSAAAIVPREPELFVFRGSEVRDIVLAVVAPAISAEPSARFDIRIHAGAKTWVIKGIRPLQSGVLSERDDCRVFAGEVLGRTAGAGCTAAVLQSSLDFARGTERIGVWAEIRGEDGSRWRVGNPLTASLLAQDPTLSRIYHATSPSEDRALFIDALAGRIATIAAANGVASPKAHAARLAARLLPDVIHYWPDLPVGFNFAHQNGRHPADDATAVVNTILTGAVCTRTTARRVQLTQTFPFFPMPTVAA